MYPISVQANSPGKTKGVEKKSAKVHGPIKRRKRPLFDCTRLHPNYKAQTQAQPQYGLKVFFALLFVLPALIYAHVKKERDCDVA